ncbi:MAG: hypothetical protein WDA22_01690 [Bacteroidota bacterium]
MPSLFNHQFTIQFGKEPSAYLALMATNLAHTQALAHLTAQLICQLNPEKTLQSVLRDYDEKMRDAMNEIHADFASRYLQ